MKKQTVGCSYSGVDLAMKKEWTTDAHNMDESKISYAKWKKTDKKGYILCDSVYIKQ